MESVGSSAAQIFVIFACIIGVTVVPMTILSGNNDNIVQVEWQQAVQEFVTDVMNTGKLRLDKLSALEEKLATAGVVPELEKQIMILDENAAKKVSQANYTKIGENTYYSIYDLQIDDMLSEDGEITLKEGDIFILKAKNTSPPVSQQLDLVSSEDTYTYSAQSSGTVTTNGSGK